MAGIGSSIRALVVETRPHATADPFPALVGEGCTVRIYYGRPTEREWAMDRPDDLAVLFIDPDRAADLALVARLARAGVRHLLVVLPATSVDGSNVAASLDAGACCYIRDSDGPAAFRAFIHALIRTDLHGQLRRDAEKRVTVVRDLEIDSGRRAAFYGETKVRLTDTEFQLLEYLAQQAGIAVTHESAYGIVNHGSAPTAEPGAAVKVYVGRIRKKLEAAGAPRDMIVNIHGCGYMLEPKPELARPPRAKR
jgi:DNA-binding response OmpR family regulator